MACLLAGISDGLIKVAINEASQNDAPLKIRRLIVFTWPVLIALGKDRPITLFDGTAAHQDPDFRSYTCSEGVLSGLKRQEMTIIAVSHEDRHFLVTPRW